MIKQCGYCYRVQTEEGEYCDIGLTEPVVEIYVASPKKEKVLISHAVCSECFEAMMNAVQKNADHEESNREKHVEGKETLTANPTLTTGAKIV